MPHLRRLLVHADADKGARKFACFAIGNAGARARLCVCWGAWACSRVCVCVCVFVCVCACM